jgi:Domain of unknown function (DUF5664)
VTTYVENPKAAAATRDTKPRLDLLEHEADVQIAEALATGADKYGTANYLDVPIKARVYGGAIRRHVGAWLSGEDDDPESGLSHLAHVGANVHVLLATIAGGEFVDDRGPVERTPEQEQRSSASNGYVEAGHYSPPRAEGHMA